MEESEKLMQMCLVWDQMVRVKEARVKQIQNPILRIVPCLDLVARKIELREMEKELCRHITLELDYAVLLE